VKPDRKPPVRLTIDRQVTSLTLISIQHTTRAPNSLTRRRGRATIGAMSLHLLASWIATQAAGPGGSAERIRTSPVALLVAGALAIAAVYFLIRLVEWDQMNEETPDQEDPLA